MMNRISTFFSVIFHPIFMLLWYLLYLYLASDVNFGASFYSVIVLFSAIIPIVAILIGHAAKIISSYQMQERKDRYFIYAITIISYFKFHYITSLFKKFRMFFSNFFNSDNAGEVMRINYIFQGDQILFLDAVKNLFMKIT